VLACASIRQRWQRSKVLTASVERLGRFKGFGRSRGCSLNLAAGCQRPLVEVQQLGASLIQANADGEPEKVLKW
jgi:hypothetical protein